MNVTVQSPQYRGVRTETLEVNALGAFEMEFPIPQDAALGTYVVTLGEQDYYSTAAYSFLVAEYEKPDFSINLSGKKDTVILGQEEVKVSVDAQYYAGTSLSQATGKYRLSFEPYYFDGGKTKGYIFGERNLFRGFGYFDMPYPDFFEKQTESSGDFLLSQLGKHELSLPLDDSTDKQYTLSVTVTDPNTKKSISQNYSFVGLRSAVMP